MMILQEKIKHILQTDLPGAGSHRKMLPPGRVLTAAPSHKNRVKKSSVLLLLFHEKNELMACLIKRPKHMKHHAGQIALPGGRMEDGETAEETALRETFEEIGVDRTKITIIGQLSKFYVEVSRFEIQPIVGWLDQRPTVKLCCDEVEKVLYFPVRKFGLPHDTIELHTITGKLEVPCVKYDGEIIWGATAMILSEFYDVVKDSIETIPSPGHSRIQK
ncbi:CoA pyrophosphatase [Prolixibacteraceae bacterium Z1-6]|uniref:CoA pyrophosphatase n=1 Tax=Draconibacterium aestuarii TaxID=2998507 RepID=A0A9X3FBV2_9BACT|nr:CoA pyrophosphatase [Prolixibacteraceae bacterium Z1-6]